MTYWLMAIGSGVCAGLITFFTALAVIAALDRKAMRRRDEDRALVHNMKMKADRVPNGRYIEVSQEELDALKRTLKGNR